MSYILQRVRFSDVSALSMHAGCVLTLGYSTFYTMYPPPSHIIQTLDNLFRVWKILDAKVSGIAVRVYVEGNGTRAMRLPHPPVTRGTYNCWYTHDFTGATEMILCAIV